MTSKANSESEALLPINEKVLTILVERHRQFIRFLSRRLPNEEIAEDLLQLSLRKALENPPSSNEEQSIVKWFYQVLKNTLTDFYRSRASELNRMNEYQRNHDIHAKTNEPSPDEIESAVCECMKALLPTLKESYAEVIEKIDLNGESIESVSQELGITPNNLMVRLYRARNALKTSLVRTCGTCTEHGCLDCTCESF